jgi:hypothetical protein
MIVSTSWDAESLPIEHYKLACKQCHRYFCFGLIIIKFWHKDRMSSTNIIAFPSRIESVECGL